MLYCFVCLLCLLKMYLINVCVSPNPCLMCITCIVYIKLIPLWRTLKNGYTTCSTNADNIKLVLKHNSVFEWLISTVTTKSKPDLPVLKMICAWFKSKKLHFDHCGCYLCLMNLISLLRHQTELLSTFKSYLKWFIARNITYTFILIFHEWFNFTYIVTIMAFR